jgi:hypothetical protein
VIFVVGGEIVMLLGWMIGRHALSDSIIYPRSLFRAKTCLFNDRDLPFKNLPTDSLFLLE